MQHVGIDMSKADFHASFDDSGKTAVFANVPDGYREFVSALERRGCVPAHTAIGVEATGTYHLPFAAALSASGWRVTVINPLLTKRLSQTKLRQVKTDRIDAGLVRRSLMQGDGYPFLETPELIAVKTLVAERAALVAVRSDIKRRQEAREYRVRAAGMPVHDAYMPVTEAIGREIKAIGAELALHAPETQELLQSIPGVGPVSSAAIVAGIVDVRRFDDPKKLVAFLGLECRVANSGTSVRGKGYITKRGDRSLRHQLFMSAFIAKRRIPELGAYYAKKKSEGHHHVSALCAVERKLIHIIWAVWTRGTPFVQKTPTPAAGVA